MVKIAKNAGFCGGVKRAYDMALDLAKKYGKVYTLGELVHNELVISFLESNGVFCLKLDQLDILKAGDVALIRAHGIPKQIEEDLKNRGVLVFDATCTVVKKNQELLSERSKTDDIIVIGDKNHDEVEGYLSYAQGPIKVVSEFEELKFGDKNTSLIFQTTILKEKFKQFEEYTQKYLKNSNILVGIFDTCCYNTTIRQEETRTLARESDVVLVLGSKHSANTIRLYEVAKEINNNVYHVSSIEEFKSLINSKKIVGVISIVAGASTPPWLIQEVAQMSETQTTATEEIKEATLQEEEMTQEQLMNQNKGHGFVTYKVGNRIKGTVILANEKGIFVTIGGKKDGFIDKEDATLDGKYDPKDYKKGDELFAQIIETKGEYVSLSKKVIDAKKADDEAAEAALSQSEFSLKMTEVVKGGLRGKIGKYTVFVPASQIKMGFVKNLEEYKDKTLTLMLMPDKDEKKAAVEGAEDAPAEEAPAAPKKKSTYLFASHKMVLEKQKKEKDDAFWNGIHVNDVVTGKVKRFTSFGAFVSVKGYDCLAHVSELSWTKVTDASKVLKIGESYDFVVLKMDRETEKVSLGYKQLQPKPYQVAAEKYPVGTIVKGTVHSIHPYGAFILIEDGIDGLVHVSQISHKWIKDANEALKVGDEVEAKIIGFDENRITLSIKELLPVPEEAPQAEDAAATDEAKAAKKASRAKKFEQKVEAGETAKKERRAKKDKAEETVEFHAGDATNNTLAELLKNFKAED